LNNSTSHIVFLTPGFAENEQDSYTIPAMQLFFKEFQHHFSGKISIITFQFPRKAENYTWNGIDVYALGGNNKKVKKLLIWQKAKHLFKRLHAELEVTHIHSFWMGECAFIGAELAKKHHISHYCTLMGQDVLPGNSYFKKVKEIPQLITLSNFHSDQLKNNYQLTSNIIPWGIPSHKQKTRTKNIDLIVVSSLIPLKCVNEFVAVVQTLKKEFPAISCKIIGDGLLRKDIKQQIDSAELATNIELLGIKNYNETQQLIAQSKILVHLSNFESFGMVIIEALELNTKVIAKPVGIAKEIEEVIKVKTIGETKTAIQQLLTGKNDVASTKYPIEKTVQSYFSLLNE